MLLFTLNRFSSLQKQRSPHVPVFSTDEETDRSALMMSIASIVPDHTQRLENIKLAEHVQQKRKLELSPSRRALKEFERALKNQQTKLRHTNHLEEIESQMLDKVKSFYLYDKKKRQQELEKEMQIKEDLKKKKKQKEMEIIKAKFKVEEERLKQEEERQKEELKKVKLEKEKLERERKKNKEERKKIEELKKQQEEQKRMEEIRRQEEEEEHRRKETERLKQLEENLRLEMEKEKAEERKKMEKERLKQGEEMLKKEIEKEKMEERKKFEEEQRLFDDLLSNDSPSLIAKRKDLLWKQIQERAKLELEEESRKAEKQNQLRSQQMVMDNLTTMVGSTPLINWRTGSPSKTGDYSNSFQSHHSSPYLPQGNGFNSDRNLLRFNHLDTSFPSAPIPRKLVPSLSTDLKQEPSYDTLDKLFKSEENMSQTNHYDLPWSSKKLSLTGGAVQRRGTIGSSPNNHRRNKSEGVSDIAIQPKNSLPQRENLTPSPGFHHTYVRTSHTPPPRNSPSSSFNKPHSPVYDDVGRASPTTNGLPSHVDHPPPLGMLPSKSSSSFTSAENGLPSSYPQNGILPTYSQVIKTTQRNHSSSPANGHRHRSHTTNARLTHYPLTTNSQKQIQKPSVSYV